MLEVLFIISTVLILYTFAGYPFVIWLLARFFAKKHLVDAGFEPSVTLVISAYNEEKVIRSKLENSLAIDYPKNKFTVIVVSDGSTDATDTIVKQYADRGVRLVRPKERRGKTAGLNVALEHIASEIVVFSDANAIYDQQAVRNLVRHFTDRNVGYSVGYARYVDENFTAAAKSEGTYWDLEILLKKWESDFASVVGGDGALYAIRRKLWEPLEETDINDFVNPLQIVAKGYRGIFDPEAFCDEAPSGEFNKEFSRKVRIVNRSFSGLLRVPAVLNPFRVGRFALLVISHKLLRWLSPYMLTCHFILTLVLGRETGLGGLPTWSAGLYAVMGCLALIGFWQDRTSQVSIKIFYLPYYFYLINVASARGIWFRLKGVRITTWDTVREGQSSKGLGGSASALPLALIVALALLSMVLETGHTGQLAIISAYGLSGLIIYAFIGYPAYLFVVSRFFKINHQFDEDYLPSVTLLIAAYNEESVIEEKILNSLEIDYPADKLRIVIASDGSVDKTNELVHGFEDCRVQLLAYTPNRGKISVLNDAIETIESEVVVFSDANVMYDSQAIRKLTRHFSDSRVGGVSGKVVLLNDTLSYGHAEDGYYSIEHFIQEKEGESGALIGSDGAMYAIRRELFQPLPVDTILDDFAISMRVVCQGYLLLHEKEALGFERNTEEIPGEFRRKARVIAGGIQCLLRGIGIPRIDRPLLLHHFISHKLLRWVIGPMTVVLFILLAGLKFSMSDIGWFLSLIFYGMCICFVVAITRHLIPALKRVIPANLIYYLIMLKLASLVGCYKGITGRQSVTWRRN